MIPDFDTLKQSLDAARAQFGVPGAVLTLARGNQLVEAASGVVNLDTKVPATTDTLFQIGSITKLYTATLVMQLVDEGRLSLDEPVRRWLPEFRVGDPDTSARVTLRHLLSHTSGIDGDYFQDAGRGEDRVAKFVGMISDLPNIHPLGAMFSYCNVGFVIAGRLIEIVCGQTWDKAMRQRLIKPLGTPSFSTLPEQAMRYLTAIGHVGAAGQLRVAPIAFLAQSNGPAGATPMARARDLVAFSRLHLALGITADGQRLISERSAEAMRESQVACPKGAPMDALGLGFFLWNWGGRGFDVIGHNGSTIGQASWLRVHPESGTMFVLLTNGGNGKGLVDHLLRTHFEPLAGIAPPLPPKPIGSMTGPVRRYVGRYGKTSETVTVSAEADGLHCLSQPSASFGVLAPGSTVTLQPVDADGFIAVQPGMTVPTGYRFLGDDGTGRAQYLNCSERVFRRID